MTLKLIIQYCIVLVFKMKLPVRIFRFNMKLTLLIIFFTVAFVYIIPFHLHHDSNSDVTVLKRFSFGFENYPNNLKYVGQNSSHAPLHIPSESELRMKWVKEKVERMSRKMRKPIIDKLTEVATEVKPNYHAHIFYYSWYRNPEVDGKWKHWNHEYIPNWRKDEYKSYPSGTHNPPHDIGSNFFPRLGCYSSRNSTVIDIHMRQIRHTGIGVVVVSWYPPGFPDSPDDIFWLLLDTAGKHQLRIAPHIEPYTHRNPINLHQYIKYFSNKYGSHKALHRMSRRGRQLPVYYIYDSYLTSSTLWRELLTSQGNLSVRGTQYDGVFLGLLVEMQHRYEIKKANFDGFYTYFATNGFTYGSSWKNWRSLSKFGRQSGLLFVPCIGPGYSDTAVRAWNTANARHRLHGNYYEVGWRSALAVRPQAVAVTSFNEWHEGTQIEPAVSKKTKDFTYLDYEPEGPDFYLNLTRWWIKQFTSLSN